MSRKMTITLALMIAVIASAQIETSGSLSGVLEDTTYLGTGEKSFDESDSLVIEADSTLLFSIELLSQRWLYDERSETDLCSHGYMVITIGGHTVTDGTEDYGFSETALALLRTLESDHTPKRPIVERMVFHGCGTILMSGCPIGVDWSVMHEAGDVILSDVVVYPTTNESHALPQPGAEARLPLRAYRAQVVPFAQAVQEFFEQAPARQFDEEFENRLYDEFWAEFKAILERQRSL